MEKELRKIRKKLNKLAKSIKPITDKISELEKQEYELSEKIKLAKIKQKYERKYFEVHDWDRQVNYIFVESIDDDCHIVASGFTSNLHGYKQHAFYNSDKYFFRNVLDSNAKAIELTKEQFVEKYQEFKNELLKIELTHGN